VVILPRTHQVSPSTLRQFCWVPISWFYRPTGQGPALLWQTRCRMGNFYHLLRKYIDYGHIQVIEPGNTIGSELS